ncbi:MAG: hypothetical protein ABIA97_00290, partial [Candidatus Omnitrophota bacterium]
PNDKEKVKDLIYKIPSLKNINLDPIFGETKTPDEIDNLIEQYGYIGAYLMYHLEGDLPSNIKSIIMRMAKLIDENDKYNTTLIIFLRSIPVDLAYEMLNLIDIQSVLNDGLWEVRQLEAIKTYEQIGISIRDDSKKLEITNRIAYFFDSPGGANSDVSELAASAYSKIALSIEDPRNKMQMLNIITNLLHDKSWRVRRSAIIAYSPIALRIDNDNEKLEMLDMLIGLSADDDDYVHRDVISLYNRIAASIKNTDKKLEILNNIAGLLNDENYNVRIFAAAICGAITSSLGIQAKKIEILSKLKKLFSDKVSSVRKISATAYGQIASTLDKIEKMKIIDDENLLELFCKDKDRSVSSSAAAAYATIVSSIEDDEIKLDILVKLKGLLKENNFPEFGISLYRSNVIEAYIAIAVTINKAEKNMDILEFLLDIESEDIPHADWGKSVAQRISAIDDPYTKIKMLERLKNIRVYIGTLSHPIISTYKQIISEIKSDDINMLILNNLLENDISAQWFASGIGQAAINLTSTDKKIEIMNKITQLYIKNIKRDRERKGIGTTLTIEEQNALISSYSQILLSIEDKKRKIEIINTLMKLLSHEDRIMFEFAIKVCDQLVSGKDGILEKAEILDKFMSFFDKNFLTSYIIDDVRSEIGRIASYLENELEKNEILNKLMANFPSRGSVLVFCQICSTMQNESKKMEILGVLTKLLIKNNDYGIDIAIVVAYGQIASTINDTGKKMQILDKLVEFFNRTEVRKFAASAYTKIISSIDDVDKKLEILGKLTKIVNSGNSSNYATSFYSQITSSLLEPYRPQLEALYQSNHARFTSSYDTNITQIKKSPYEIKIDKEKGLIQGIVNGEVVVTQPILREVNEELLSSQNFILNHPDTKRDLIDLMFFTSLDKLTPVFLLGPTATGKTAEIRYLA